MQGVMADKKSGFVAMIGRPNVGKSTLLNHFVGLKVAITSNKPQTTRNRIRGILTEDRGQIVFFDTPGIHKAKNKLGQFMVNAASSATKEVDIILWLVEPDSKVGKGDLSIAKDLSGIDVPVFLVINKVDTKKNKDILPVIDAFKDILDFEGIFPISALKGNGCDELLDEIYKNLPIGPYMYEEDALTDQPIRQMCAEIIREKSLHALSDELPHGIAIIIDDMKLRTNKKIYDIDATIICEKDSHKGMIIGKQGQMLKKIGQTSRYEIEKLVEKQVNLRLWVKVKKDWRDNDRLIQNFGYRDE